MYNVYWNLHDIKLVGYVNKSVNMGFCLNKLMALAAVAVVVIVVVAFIEGDGGGLVEIQLLMLCGGIDG